MKYQYIMTVAECGVLPISICVAHGIEFNYGGGDLSTALNCRTNSNDEYYVSGFEFDSQEELMSFELKYL